MIHVEGLTKYYGGFCAVDGIDFDIKSGEIVGLLGPNGAGKTTTLRMLTGYLSPTAGTIRIGDHSIEEAPLKIKGMMGYLPESAPLYHDMLVHDYVDYISRIRGIEERDERIRSVADLCGLREIMHKPIGELSRGLKQRVGLAHAMMSDPEILILDEPTSGLDPNQIVEIREIIRRIGTEKTVIISTHILSEAEATCDRIIIIHRGRIVADDGTDRLKLSAGGQAYITLTLEGADLASVTEKLAPLPGVRAVERTGGEHEAPLHVRVICEPTFDMRREVYRAVRETGWDLLEFRGETRTLESIFRELTKEN